jgi:hypothetical protein
VDDPIALIDRAKRILEGTAPKLFAFSPLKVALAIEALAALNIPGPFDDLARMVSPGPLSALLSALLP